MWIVGSVAAIVGLIVVIAAFVFDQPVDEERPSVLPPGLPRPADVRSLRFPTTTWGGYDHRVVDAELAELAERYEALYLAAGPSILAEAERRLAGTPTDRPSDSPAAPAVQDEPLGSPDVM